MTEEIITIPLWSFWLLSFLAVLTVFRFFWLLLSRYLNRKTFKARQRLDEQLSYGLSSYRTNRRAEWIRKLRREPEVREIINNYSIKEGIAPDVLQKRVDSYLEEIVPSFNLLLYFRIGFWLARSLLRAFYTIQVGHADPEVYDAIDKNTCVMIVSNHRSNIDPLIHIYLSSRHSSISFSAGEWARGWPFRQLFHAIGFYIVKRDSGDTLYRKILERYIIQSVQNCIPLGLFLEGQLSRDGNMQSLKLGTLNYAIKAMGTGYCDDIIIIPSAISYDKVPEDKTLVQHQDKSFQNKGRLYSLLSFLRFVATTGFKLFNRRYKPFGYACANYGKPLSIMDWQKQRGVVINDLSLEQRREVITEIGELLGEKINQLMPVPPTAILSRVLLDSTQEIVPALTLKSRAFQLISQLRSLSNDLVLADTENDFALDQGILILVKNQIIHVTQTGDYQVLPEQLRLLEFYASIVNKHLD